jgi:hypothetical protein
MVVEHESKRYVPLFPAMSPFFLRIAKRRLTLSANDPARRRDEVRGFGDVLLDRRSG